MKKAILTIEFASIAMMAAFASKMEKAGYDLESAETGANETGDTTVKGTATTAVKKNAAPADKADKTAAKGKTADKKTEAAETAKTADKKPFKEATPEEQLDAIRTIVTRHGKKGKTDDMKRILNVYGVLRAGELDEKDYEPAFRMLVRYEKGDSIDEIVPADTGDDNDASDLI